VESQRKTAKNYRFSWDPLMVEDMEEELRTLQTDSTNHGDLYDIQEEEDQSQSDKEDEGAIYFIDFIVLQN
jgi:hypothetical protein